MFEEIRELSAIHEDDGYAQSSRYGILNLHEHYTKLSEPSEPLYFDRLPADIKALLGGNAIDVEDFSLVDTIRVIHAY